MGLSDCRRVCILTLKAGIELPWAIFIMCERYIRGSINVNDGIQKVCRGCGRRLCVNSERVNSRERNARSVVNGLQFLCGVGE